MVQFSDWCDTADSNVGLHWLRLISAGPFRLNTGIAATASVVPSHYAAEERVAAILRRLGKPAAAQFVEDKLPTDDSGVIAPTIPEISRPPIPGLSRPPVPRLCRPPILELIRPPFEAA